MGQRLVLAGALACSSFVLTAASRPAQPVNASSFEADRGSHDYPVQPVPFTMRLKPR